MTASHSTLASTRQVSWPRHAAREALAIVLCYAVAAPLVYWLQDTHGLAVASVAGAVCLFAALGASAAAGVAAAGRLPYVPAMVAMVLRLILSLIFCVVIAVGAGQVLAREIAVYLVLFYMVTLAIETGFALSRVRAALPSAALLSHSTTRGL